MKDEIINRKSHNNTNNQSNKETIAENAWTGVPKFDYAKPPPTPYEYKVIKKVNLRMSLKGKWSPK
jgi:hypothetical protein